MHFSPIFTITALAASALAAPLEKRSANWSIRSFTRTCTTDHTQCTYEFGIDTNDGSPVQHCGYVILAPNAPTQDYSGVGCGAYTISSGWSGYFGPGKGFQTLSVVSNGNIVWPGYTDAELVNGKAISPDKTYSVTHLG